MKPQELKIETTPADKNSREDSVAGTTNDIIYYILVSTVFRYRDKTSTHYPYVLGYYFDDRAKARALARSLAGGTEARSVLGANDDWYESKPEISDGIEHYTLYQVKQLKAWEDGMAALVL